MDSTPTTLNIYTVTKALQELSSKELSQLGFINLSDLAEWQTNMETELLPNHFLPLSDYNEYVVINGSEPCYFVRRANTIITQTDLFQNEILEIVQTYFKTHEKFAEVEMNTVNIKKGIFYCGWRGNFQYFKNEIPLKALFNFREGNKIMLEQDIRGVFNFMYTYDEIGKQNEAKLTNLLNHYPVLSFEVIEFLKSIGWCLMPPVKPGDFVKLNNVSVVKIDTINYEQDYITFRDNYGNIDLVGFDEIESILIP